MKKLLAGVGILAIATFGLSTGALAAPNPSPTAPTHTVIGCSSVISNNPNVSGSDKMALPAMTNFYSVGSAFCFPSS